MASGGREWRAAREERLEPAALRRPGGASLPPAFACRAAWGVAGVLRRRARPFGLFRAAALWNPGLARGRYSRRVNGTPGYGAAASPTFWRSRRWVRSPFRSRGRGNTRMARAQPHCFHLLRSTLITSCTKLVSRTVPVDCLRILSWEE